MNAIDLLKKQHEEAKSLFRQIESAREPVKKQQLFEQLADALAVHATIEEKHFYPASRNAATEDLLREALEEHLAAKRLIADLLECDAEDEQFDAKIMVLKEEIEHHVEEEEEDLFPKVKNLLSADELEDLAVVMEDLAEELKEQGEPRAAVPNETAQAAPLE